MILFGQRSIDRKRGVKAPPGGGVEIEIWPFGQEVVIQIFERWSCSRIIEEVMQGGQFFSDFSIIPSKYP